jgi:hypothetical protein
MYAAAIGFHAMSKCYPSLGQGSFGHNGAGGQQAFADPRNDLAYGTPAAAAPENACLIGALDAAADEPR